MPMSLEDIRRIAQLSHLNLTDDEIAFYRPQLGCIFELVDDMNEIDTEKTEAMAHSLDVSQRLRPDVVTEPNQRKKFQTIAPRTEAGLYIVPKVIDDET